jgi:hypothetical protein
VLLRALRGLIEGYRLKPDDVDPKTASAWYSTRGCASPACLVRSARLGCPPAHTLRGAPWLISNAGPGCSSASSLEEYELSIEPGQEDVFLTSLNDYRLMLAARHDIGEAEMDRHRLEDLEPLPAAQRTALFEIHFHAVILEEVLWELQGGTT